MTWIGPPDGLTLLPGMQMQMRRCLILVFLICMQGPSASPKEEYPLLSEVLRTHVRDGRVDYRGLRTDPRLQKVVREFTDSRPELLSSREEQMAFWINAYNVFTLKLIADHYPVESINDLHSAPGLIAATVLGRTVWDRYEFSIGGKMHTLNHIEHRILRANYGDFRIHAAINCASKSCPNLRSEAFEPGKLDAQLDHQMRAFLASSFHNRFDPEKNVLYLSKIFSWFKGDFEKSKALIESLRPFLPLETARRVNEKTEIRYIDYDWQLNQ